MVVRATAFFKPDLPVACAGAGGVEVRAGAGGGADAAAFFFQVGDDGAGKFDLPGDGDVEGHG